MTKYKVRIVNGLEEPPYECEGYNAAMDYAEAKERAGWHVTVEALEERYRLVAEFNAPSMAKRQG